MRDDDHSTQPGADANLSHADAAALDALVEAGFDLSRVAPIRAERAARVASILGLLSPAVAADLELDKPTLTNVTLARIMRAPAGADSNADTHPDTHPDSNADHASGPRLSDADALALDAWIDAKFVVDDVAADLRPRAQRHDQLASLARDVRVPDGALLTQRTLARISAADAEQMKAERSAASAGGRWRLPRWPEIVSIAASLLLAASVLLPMLGAMRNSAMKAQCSANLGSVAGAFGTYAHDHADQMPSVVASLGPGAWWDVGGTETRSNSANLFTLARAGYTKLGALACPGNAHACRDRGCGPEDRDWRSLDEVSYSYQLMYGQHRPAWHAGQRRVVLADRSPVVIRAVRGQWYPGVQFESSPNHAATGQHALYTDGSAGWLGSPVLAPGTPQEDNIWLPKPRRIQISATVTPTAEGVQVQLTGRELPVDKDDVFLGP